MICCSPVSKPKGNTSGSLRRAWGFVPSERCLERAPLENLLLMIWKMVLKRTSGG
uniref:Uncharacterized protein n=1 Tax=Arcella intermedia TaxID=1963864 RepID=A0A6B2LSH0_9EUKA